MHGGIEIIIFFHSGISVVVAVVSVPFRVFVQLLAIDGDDYC